MILVLATSLIHANNCIMLALHSCSTDIRSWSSSGSVSYPTLTAVELRFISYIVSFFFPRNVPVYDFLFLPTLYPQLRRVLATLGVRAPVSGTRMKISSVL